MLETIIQIMSFSMGTIVVQRVQRVRPGCGVVAARTMHQRQTIIRTRGIGSRFFGALQVSDGPVERLFAI